jgi:hypothetical protein
MNYLESPMHTLHLFCENKEAQAIKNNKKTSGRQCGKARTSIISLS